MRKVKYRLPTSNVHCLLQVLSYFISKANNSKHFLGKDEEDGQALLQAPLPIERKQNSLAKKTNHQWRTNFSWFASYTLIRPHSKLVLSFLWPLTIFVCQLKKKFVITIIIMAFQIKTICLNANCKVLLLHFSFHEFVLRIR